MSSSIRLMEEKDLDQVMNIERMHHYSPWSRQQFLSCLENDIVWVLTDEEEILGYIVFKIILDEMDLLNIVVAQSHQGKGLGRQLLTALFDEAKKLKRPTVFLEVRRSNTAAIYLYESCNFRQVGLRKNYYFTETGREDALIYQFNFDENFL